MENKGYGKVSQQQQKKIVQLCACAHLYHAEVNILKAIPLTITLKKNNFSLCNAHTPACPSSIAV